ncbi:GAF and ANTAR domain-containing protein [Solihabitans fulvus]|uniref:GAF and ANTAR domain-containing protein n=2 Tax=Solihabitans fulvus TaxID=1892852 RepID=A0A5B2WVL5_9PSEU|nr:GAF and ANTAR domain-containing protein [Solihabitans fulvus]
MLTLGQELAEVTRLVEHDDVPATLERYVARVVRTVPGCHHATITVLTDRGADTVAGAGEPLLACRPDDPAPVASPVLESLVYREPRRLDDVRTDQRWSAYADLLAQAGYRSVLALPLVTDTEPSAVFTLFSREPGKFGETSFDVVLLFALHAGVVFDNVTLYQDSKSLVEQLRGALRTRTVIGQAQGLLMQCNGYDATTAFAALTTASQHHNIKLRDVAATLVAAHEQHDLEVGLAKFGLSVSR